MADEAVSSVFKKQKKSASPVIKRLFGQHLCIIR